MLYVAPHSHRESGEVVLLSRLGSNCGRSSLIVQQIWWVGRVGDIYSRTCIYRFANEFIGGKFIAWFHLTTGNNLTRTQTATQLRSAAPIPFFFLHICLLTGQLPQHCASCKFRVVLYVIIFGFSMSNGGHFERSLKNENVFLTWSNCGSAASSARE